MRFFWLLMVPLLSWGIEGTLVRIVDGDTLVFQNNNGTQTFCQLAFIDAPEDQKNSRLIEQVSRCALPVSAFLEAGKAATTFIQTQLSIDQAYRYELLSPMRNRWANCLVHIPKAAHAQLHPTINGVMLDQGYAVPFPLGNPSSHEKTMKKFFETAYKEKRGLWKSHPEVMECLLNPR